MIQEGKARVMQTRWWTRSCDVRSNVWYVELVYMSAWKSANVCDARNGREMLQGRGARGRVGGTFHCSIQASASLVLFAQKQRDRYSTRVVGEVWYSTDRQAAPTTRGRGVTLIVWSLPSPVPKRRSA